MGRFFVGLSGYSYKEWQGEGRFYPPGTKAASYFEYYCSKYSTVELDGTWYQMPAESAVAKWIATSCDGFQFAPKMHRRVTHMARLKPESLDSVTFFLKRLEPMERAGKLGPILVQLPPNLKRDDARLASFLEAIPHRPGLRWAVEFRNESWNAEEVEEALRKFGVAWVGQDTDAAEAQRRHTADFIYIRLRKSDYPIELLREWARYFRQKMNEGADVFVYCKHEDAEAPWEWADILQKLIAAT